MKFGRTSTVADNALDINLTPLIDVVFLLLIFFSVTTTFSDAKQLDIELPQAATSKNAIEAKELVVTITKGGSFFIGEKPYADSALTKQLQDLVKTSSSSQLLIRADTKTPHGRVVQLMDIAKQTGITSIGISATADGK